MEHPSIPHFCRIYSSRIALPCYIQQWASHFYPPAPEEFCQSPVQYKPCFPAPDLPLPLLRGLQCSGNICHWYWSRVALVGLGLYMDLVQAWIAETPLVYKRVSNTTSGTLAFLHTWKIGRQKTSLIHRTLTTEHICYLKHGNKTQNSPIKPHKTGHLRASEILSKIMIV